MSRRLILLGPQPNYKSLGEALERLGAVRRVAFITAGWEEDEGEDQALRKAMGCDAVNLRLFHRTEQVFASDPEFIELLKQRQDELRVLRDVYNSRLGYLLPSARETLACGSELLDLDPEKELAIDLVRQLDHQYFVRTSQVCDTYEGIMQAAQRPQVVAHRAELEEIVSGCDALMISGGHVGIILNRLRIFGILELNAELPVIACSGGAMALAEQVVFFHDSPPQGPGNPEVLRAGMGVFHETLPLPGARSRLQLDDQARVALFARRFPRYECVVFDDRTLMDRCDGKWTANGGAVRLGTDGDLIRIGHD